MSKVKRSNETMVRSSGASAREPSRRCAAARGACLLSSRKAVPGSSWPARPPAPRPPPGPRRQRDHQGVRRRAGRAGGSGPMWLVLISLKTRPRASQRELADAVGIREATLTHHLNAMDTSGLITRRRDPENRRVHLVELTPAGRKPSTGCAGRPSRSTPGSGPARRGRDRGVRAGTRPAARQRLGQAPGPPGEPGAGRGHGQGTT